MSSRTRVMSTFVFIVCSMCVLHSATATALRPGMKYDLNHTAEAAAELGEDHLGAIISRTRRQVSLRTLIGWFWDLLGAGQTIFETVVVFYGFIEDSIKKKKMIYLHQEMQDIEEQLGQVTDDFTEARTLHLTLATLCLGAGGGVQKRSLDSMEYFNLTDSMMKKFKSGALSRSRREVNISALIETFLEVYQYPDVPMNLLQFANDNIGIFTFGKEPRTVTEIKQQFDEVEEQIETLKESVEGQLFMMRQHATPKPPCQRKSGTNIPLNSGYGSKYSSYPGYESHWTRNRRSLTLDGLLQSFWSFWDYFDILLTVYGAIADAKSVAPQPEETDLADFGERLEGIQRNLTELMESIDETAAQSRQYFDPDPCKGEYRYTKTTTQRPRYTYTTQHIEESPWTNYIDHVGQQGRFFGDNPVISAIGDKILPVWNFIKPAFSIFALYADVTSVTGFDKKDPDLLEKIDEQLDDIREKISDLTNGLHIVSLTSLRSALDVCKKVGR